MESTLHRTVIADSRLLEGVEEPFADIVVTSPPYPMIEMWDSMFSALSGGVGGSLAAGRADEAFETMHAELDHVWKGIYRSLREGGIACIVVGDATRTVNGGFRLFPNHSRIISACTGAGFHPLPCILWRKQSNKPNKFMGSGMFPPSAYPTLEHEHILIFRKGAARRFATAEGKAARKRSAFFWEERNLWFSDVWEDLKGERQVNAPGASRERKASFPSELARRLICMFSVQGDTVLDPFLGSGTTSIAAAECARNSVGYETDGSFMDTISRRFSEAPVSSRAYTESRLRNHTDRMRDLATSGRRPKYRSRQYGFPVVTSQEVDIELPVVAVSRETVEGSYSVEYL